MGGDVVYIPPGWFHAVRTWRPTSEERGLPFSIGVNFWHDCNQELREKEKLFRLLDVCSIQQALVGDRDALLEDFVSRLDQAAAASEAEASVADDQASAAPA